MGGTVYFDSKGTGDLNIKCECMNLQETYELEDLLIYRETVSNTDTFNLALPNHFQISMIVRRTSSSYSYCYPILTDYQLGVLREKGSLSIRVREGSPFADNNTTIVPLNTDTLMTYEYNNGLHSLNANNVTVSGTENTYPIGSLTRIYIQKYTVTDLKIKPL